MRFLLFLLQDFIARTDRSQSRLESLADVHPIHSWAGMNAECQSPASGNTEGGGGGGGYRFIVTEGNPSAFCCRLLPSLVLPFNEKTNRLLPATKKKTPLQIYYSFTEREYNTFKQLNVYHYHALFI